MEEDTHKGMPGGMTFNAPVTFNAPMFDIHDNENVYVSPIDNGQNTIDNGQLTMDNEKNGDPAKPNCQLSIINCQLTTPQARALLSRLTDAGILDESLQAPDLSNTEKGVLASLLATKLEIPNLWQVFGTLWGMKPEILRVAHNKAQDQVKTSRFIERIKKIID